VKKVANWRASVAFYWREVQVAKATVQELMPHLLGTPFLSEKDRADLIHVLRTFKEIMAGSGLIYWLDYGTLLGAWRWGNPLPWDHDADIGYLAGQWQLLQARVPAFADYGMTFRLGGYGQILYESIYVDIMPWSEHGGMMARPDHRQYEAGFLKALSDRYDTFPSHWVNPLGEIYFAGDYFNCSNQVEPFLRKRYGNIDILVPHRVKALLYPQFYRYYWIFARYRPQIRAAAVPQQWTTVTNPAILQKFGIEDGPKP